MSKHVVITVDGACLGNRQPENTRAAAAAILNYQGHRRAVGEYIGHSTNQRAEIIAAAIGLESLKERCYVTLRTDSRYVTETMQGHFRRKTNFDCWERLDAAKGPHVVWFKGSSGSEDTAVIRNKKPRTRWPATSHKAKASLRTMGSSPQPSPDCRSLPTSGPIWNGR